MLKPASLRDALVAALPQLQQSPGDLSFTIQKGRVVNTGTPSLSWEYRYTLSLVIADFSGSIDAATVATLVWARRHQPDLFDHAERREQAIRFDLAPAATDTATPAALPRLAIEIDLVEAVLARPREGSPGTFDLIHKPEPPGQLDITQRELWELFLFGEKVAEWNYDPR
ncbi:P2 phage tail completion protein R (GpR) [Delftia tsuruhatensis]|uniref:phage tail protein n=1 Tax=Delftia tsuruhatensis TaxID=180282 RepID=UPI001E7D9A5A|nr:phage tail protein [Delftia tsuruhatensis]CAB5719269.1 P2 phage tail completion protein R (GpR) [Delftia tsuruhatensis]CAC9687819.1 P2 phage tail completion protein R (GpR) [Delftia tsuruhatensis]